MPLVTSVHPGDIVCGLVPGDGGVDKTTWVQHGNRTMLLVLLSTKKCGFREAEPCQPKRSDGGRNWNWMECSTEGEELNCCEFCGGEGTMEMAFCHFGVGECVFSKSLPIA